MPRIRTIKPEFPQSESMGRVTRDARLLFVLLWTLVDDSGKARGNSRMLASLLFPYDDDAKDGIDGWLLELEQEGCIVRYKADGQTYLQICNWLNHQKIDHPSKSKIPDFDESSRILASVGEKLALDQGSKDQGKDKEKTLLYEKAAKPNGIPQDKPAESVKKFPGFVRWYESYPKKENKAGALKAWVKHRCESIADDVIAATERVVSIKGWSAKDRFTPLPSSFLNARRWEDEPVPIYADKRAQGLTVAEQNAALLAQVSSGIVGNTIESDARWVE